MIRYIVETTIEEVKKYIEASGLSTDTKPTSGIITGSLFMESDTGDVYIFDETNESWTQIGGSGT